MRSVVLDSLRSPLTGEPCEFTEVAAALPVSVVCDLLGVPRTDWEFMLACTRIAFGESATSDLERIEAHADILEYYADLVDYRRREPGADLISAMANGTIDGRPLTDEEIFLNCDGLISGGNETTRQASVGGLLALIREPDQWRPATSTPDQVETTVNEVLRFTSPALHVLRTSVHDSEIAGQTISEGDAVAVWLPSANRDEAVFANPDRFDAARSPNQHLGFGYAAHHCLGSALARAELRVLFTHLFHNAAGAELTGPVQRLRSSLIWGYESLPVRLHPRSAG